MDIGKRAYALFLFFVALWCALIVVAPLLRIFSDTASLSAPLYSLFSRICHQIDERSFSIGGAKLAVCIRCSSIYFSFLGSLVLFPLVRHLSLRSIPPRSLLALAVVPMLLDVCLTVTSIYPSTTETRVVTGVLLGALLPFYILPLFLDAAVRVFGSPTIRGEPRYARKTE